MLRMSGIRELSRRMEVCHAEEVGLRSPQDIYELLPILEVMPFTVDGKKDVCKRFWKDS